MPGSTSPPPGAPAGGGAEPDGCGLASPPAGEPVPAGPEHPAPPASSRAASSTPGTRI
ncbi:hypothetical protein [Streptomyces sp. TN58]|uniref:hypothetical protein n=1 Tax=Streptomyces sp. TN58 TaxID=234612 RepID=UPI0018FEE22B|nr:hypothetical protein [Streptomyces sp. TN58]